MKKKIKIQVKVKKEKPLPEFWFYAVYSARIFSTNSNFHYN